MKPTNSVYTGLPTTIFEIMSRLAEEHKAINLGQGFPDTDGPEDLRRAAADALMAGPNQYPSMMGLPELRQAVASANKRFYGLDIDWRREVMVTSGATEALADSINAIVGPGDEVVLIEPLYDCYLPLIEHAGGKAVLVRLFAPDWRLDRDALAAAFSSRTKAILINNPMNPSGKVFSRDELELIAELVVKHDAYAICDEVYEHLVFDGGKHIPLMTLPGMRDRTVRMGSAGKTFSFTGWKVGYITAAPDLLDPIAKAHQFTTFTTPPNLQKAVALGLAKDDSYYAGLARDMEAKRDLLSSGLRDLGLPVAHSAGTYFVTADCAPLGIPGTDAELAQTMTKEAGVACVPVSAFYRGAAPGQFERFCFCKRDEVLTEALKRLDAWITKRRRAVA